MAGRQTFLIIGATLLLTVVGAFVVQEVQAQRVCTVADDAPVADQTAACGSGLRCLSGRCNLSPPVWNATVLGGTQTGAGFDVQNSSFVRGDLTVGNTAAGTGALFVNAFYSRLGMDAADTLWLGGTNNTIRIQGRLVVDDDFTIGAISCPPDQILKRNAAGTAWRCADDEVGAGGGGGAGGAVDAAALCAINIVRAISTDTDTGEAGGYTGANGNCAPAQHVCTAAEVLHTINCGVALPAGTGWISGGPPGDVAPANDCNGWTSGEPTVLGRVWTAAATGGFGSLRNCDSTLPFLCCA